MQTNRSQDDIVSAPEFGRIQIGYQGVHYVNLPFVNSALMAKSMIMQFNSDQNQAKSKAVQNSYIEFQRPYRRNWFLTSLASNEVYRVGSIKAVEKLWKSWGKVVEKLWKNCRKAVEKLWKSCGKGIQ